MLIRLFFYGPLLDRPNKDSHQKVTPFLRKKETNGMYELSISAASKFLNRLDSLNKTSMVKDGYLSKSHGFFPKEKPSTDLPKKYSIWNETAKKLPSLLKTCPNLRSYLGNEKNLPLLDASNPEELPEKYLKRASTSLWLIAMTYWNSNEVISELPNSIKSPLTQICTRLNRNGLTVTFEDLITGNWEMIDSNKEPTMGNVKMLTSTDISTENNFYAATLEMSWVGRDIPRLIAESQDLAIKGETAKLITHLDELREILINLSSAFKKITVKSGSRFEVVPRLWGRTFGTFSVSREGNNTFGGFLFPALIALDKFLCRKNYESEFGQAVKSGVTKMPEIYQDFFTSIEVSNIESFIDKNEQVKKSYEELKSAFSGKKGFLSIHRDKAGGIIEVVKELGRGESSGKHNLTNEKTLYESLEESQNERQQIKISEYTQKETPKKSSKTVKGAISNLPIISIQELSQHHTNQHGYWIALDGYVYDVSSFVGHHPGGADILRLNSGQDTTVEFNKVDSHKKSTVLNLLRKKLIGFCNENQMKSEIGVRLQKITRLENLMNLDFEDVEKKHSEHLYLLKKSSIDAGKRCLKRMSNPENSLFFEKRVKKLENLVSKFPYKEDLKGEWVTGEDGYKEIVLRINKWKETFLSEAREILLLSKNNLIISQQAKL